MQTLLLVLLCALSFTVAADVKYSEVVTVNDDTRFIAQNPGVELVVFQKTHHVKGNYVFSSGERISGDRLILNFQDSTQFTKAEDVEALIRYPAAGKDTNIITAVEIYAAVSSDDADSFFVDGGINKAYCEILLSCNKTMYLEFEMFVYGY